MSNKFTNGILTYKSDGKFEFLNPASLAITINNVTRTLSGWLTSSSDLLYIKTTSGNYNITPLNTIIEVNKTTPETTTLYLPSSPSVSEKYTIKDGAGNADSYNITIDGNGKNIDGVSTYVLKTQYSAISFYYNGTEWKAL